MTDRSRETGSNRSLSRRHLLAGGGALAMAGALAGCGGGGRDAGDGTVRFQGWDFEANLAKQNVDRFVQRNPAIKVNYTPITSAQYVQKMNAQFTAGTGPDALYVYDDSLAAWVDSEYLQPLDGMPNLDKLYSGLYPGNAQAMTYQGKRYGLPYYTDCQSLTYNADILAKAGIKTPPKSLAELEQQALKIKSAGILEYPIGLPAQLSDTWWSWWWALVYASGGKLFDANAAPIMATSDPIPTQLLGWIQNASKKSKVIDPGSLQLLPIPYDNAFMAGKFAFVFVPRYASRKYNDPGKSKIAGKVKMAPVPSLTGEVIGTVSNTRMYCLTADTPVKDNAYKLLSYLGGYDEKNTYYTAKFWFQQQGLGFAYKSLVNDPEVKAQLAKFADPAVYTRLAEIAKPRTVLNQPWYTEFETQNQKFLQQVMIGQAAPAAAAKNMANAVEQLKKQYG